MMNLSEDTEELEDFIRFDIAGLQPSEDLQLLDPGIIDLECDFEEESTSIKELDTSPAQPPDLHSQSVNTSQSNTVDLKLMCIKVVDCFKFPWYFDKFKDIIEHQLAINKSVDVNDEILDDSSTDPLKELVLNTHFVDMSVNGSVTIQRQTNECKKEETELNKEVDVIAAKKLLPEIVNTKPIPGAKSARNNVRNNKMDFDIQRAMEQRKNSVIDLKKNIGLVGMKILRLPNKTPSELPIEISSCKQLKKPMAANVTSTTPVYENTVEGMKDGSTQNIIHINSSPEPFVRSISSLVETNSNDTPLDRRCNFENEFSFELSVNKIAEEIYRLVRPQKYADNQSIVPNSCNIMTTPTKVTEEKNIKSSKYQFKSIQKYIAKGTRTTKMIDPIPISAKKRNKDRIKSQLIASEIIDISDEMSPNSPSRKSEKTKSSAEANIVSNNTPEYIKDHIRKEMSSKNKPSTFMAKPKIVLSTKKTNKLTETIIKIKEMQQSKESNINEPTKSQNQSSNMTISSTLSKSISENRFLPKQIDTEAVIIPHSKNVDTPEQVLNGNDESKIIEGSSPKISVAELQYSNRNDFENTLSKDNHPQNMTNKMSTNLNVLVKTPEKEVEKVFENNYSKSACTKFDTASIHYSNVSDPAVIVNTTTQRNQSPVMPEPLTVYNSMQAHTLYKPPESSYQTFRQSEYNAVRFPSDKSQVNQPIYNNTGHSTRDPGEILPHINPRPPSSGVNEKILPLMSPIHRLPMPPLQPTNNTGHLTHHPGEISPHINPRPPSSGVNEKILPLMSQIPRLPVPPLQPTTFEAMLYPMLNGIRPNMPTGMTHPEPNRGFGARIPSNPRPMSPFGVSLQISKPQGTVSSRMPINYPQISIGEMQSYDVLWSGPFSCMPPPPPPPPPPCQPASQDISTSSPKSVPQSMDSSIIGRNINGIVKKINITAPAIEQKEEIDSKAGIIKIENLERDASTPLCDERPTDCFTNIEPVNTKNEMLRILDTGLQRADSRFDVLNQAIEHSTIKSRPNSKKKNLLSQEKSGKSPNETSREKCNSDTRKSNKSNAVENFIKVDRTLSKGHQNKDKSLPQKKDHQHKSNHYLMNFIRKPRDKKDKKKEIPPKKCNESVRNRVETDAELTVHESGNIKISATQSSCIPEQIKVTEKTKKPISYHSKYIYTSEKAKISKKLSGKGSRTTFEDLFGDDIDDAGCEKVASGKKSTGKRHSGLVNTEKTHEKSYESSVNMKRPANDEQSALSPKYRPGPLSKKKKNNDQERVNPHQINKKQILQSKTYSDPILPIPTYENILSNIPYLSFRDDNVANSRYKKTSGSVNPKIQETINRKKEKEKDRQKLDKPESLRKISLYEYKKRSTSERKVDHEAKDKIYKKHVEMHRRPSHADSDLGYDSDSTVKL